MKSFISAMKVMSPASRVLYSAAWLVIGSVLLMLMITLYWLIWPYAGIEASPDPFTIEQTDVQSGDVISYTVQYCIDDRLPLPMTISRELELQPAANTDVTISFPVTHTIEYTMTQRCETRRFFIGIPAFVPGGKYHIHSYSQLHVNPIRVIRQLWASRDFNISPAQFVGGNRSKVTH